MKITISIFFLFVLSSKKINRTKIAKSTLEKGLAQSQKLGTIRNLANILNDLNSSMKMLAAGFESHDCIAENTTETEEKVPAATS